MALARLFLKNLHHRVLSTPSFAATSFLGHGAGERAATIGGAQSFSADSAGNTDKVASETSDGKQVSVSDSEKSRSFFSRRPGKRGLWRRNRGDFPPAHLEFFPSGLGNVLMQATENVSRLFESLNVSPWSLSGRVKEHDKFYKLKFDVPGLSKEDLMITVEDGVLTIKGEHKEEEEDKDGSNDDEFWSSSRYAYYNASLLLPEDAKADEVKAELKDGVLCITIPRTEKPKKDVKEVQIH
ncbi:Small heat shock protein HSP [Parasponia andersonii]|uniref:Small heat shock protein HSP n=1 Tax=Parasponia andersonii TaxID=3476 RepID=A0A2P5ALJ7_PARAD|nr:Small heat shock protein HSP [Parasponia andersonii]